MFSFDELDPASVVVDDTDDSVMFVTHSDDEAADSQDIHLTREDWIKLVEEVGHQSQSSTA